MMLLPMLNGGRVAKEWQPMSALICNGPISRCNNFMAEKKGRSGHPVHRPDGRGGTSAANRAAGISGISATGARPAGATQSPPALAAPSAPTPAGTAPGPPTDPEPALAAAPSPDAPNNC